MSAAGPHDTQWLTGELRMILEAVAEAKAAQSAALILARHLGLGDDVANDLQAIATAAASEPPEAKLAADAHALALLRLADRMRE